MFSEYGALPDDDVLHHTAGAVVQHGPADPADGGTAGPRFLQDVQVDQPLLEVDRHVEPLLQGAQLGGGAQVVKKTAALVQVLQLQDCLVQGHAAAPLMFRFGHSVTPFSRRGQRDARGSMV